jgi:hypothetical protein
MKFALVVSVSVDVGKNVSVVSSVGRNAFVPLVTNCTSVVVAFVGSGVMMLLSTSRIVGEVDAVVSNEVVVGFSPNCSGF